MINNINSFSEIIRPKSNTLIVLDIDETIINFPLIDKDWWDKTYDKLLPIYKENTQYQTELLWNNYISNIEPRLLDSVNLINFINKSSKNNCQIILLTARDKSISKLTIKQLLKCGFSVHPSRIYYNKNKGIELKHIVQNIFPDVKDIIFVHDLYENLINVHSTFNCSKLSKYNIILYKIKHNI